MSFLSVTFAVAAITSHTPLLLVEAQRCSEDVECVPSTCCHAVSCVHKDFAPPTPCESSQCSGGCKRWSMDCGGHCRCNMMAKQCEAVLGSGDGGGGSSQTSSAVLSNAVLYGAGTSAAKPGRKPKNVKYVYTHVKVGKGHYLYKRAMKRKRRRAAQQAELARQAAQEAANQQKQ